MSVTSDAGRSGRQRFSNVGFAEEAPLQPGSRVEQRAKGILGWTRGRSQEVTAVEAPRYVAFAGPNGYFRGALGNGTRAGGR